jgi:hypothetical protein
VGRGSTFVKEEKDLFFLIKEDHCKGHGRGRDWTIKEWLEHEGVSGYDRANKAWIEIVTSSDRLIKTNVENRLKMFVMASYNLDRFREFVFQSKFLTKVKLDPQEVENIKQDDEKLLNLAMKWLKFVLFGQEGLRIQRP